MKTALENFKSALLAPRGAALYAGLVVAGTLFLREPVPQAVVADDVQPLIVSMSSLDGTENHTAFSETSLESTRRELAQAAAARKRARARLARKVAAERAEAMPATRFVLLNRDWRSGRNLANLSVQTRRALERNRFIDSELNADFAVDATATNGWHPELESVQAALEETVHVPNDYSDRKSTEAQVDVDLALGLRYESSLREVVGEYQRENFTQIRQNLEQLKDPTIFEAVREPELVRAKPRKKKIVAKATAPSPISVDKKPVARGRTVPGSSWTARTPQLSERPFVREAAPSPAPSAPALAASTAPSEPTPDAVTFEEPLLVRPGGTLAMAPSAAEPVVQAAPGEETASAQKPVSPAPAPAIVVALPAPAKAPQKAAPSVSPVTASVGPTSLVEALPKARVVTKTDVATQKKEGFAATAATFNDAVKKAFDTTPFETDLFGRVTVNDEVADWLTRERGHIELYLQPVGSRDPQGTRYLSYRFPQPEFRDRAAALKGRYVLVAGFYRPEDVDGPYAEATYREEINAATARDHLKFDIKKRDLKVVSHSGSGDRRHATIHLSFFEGASADYREPHPIPAVNVKVVSLENEYRGIL